MATVIQDIHAEKAKDGRHFHEKIVGSTTFLIQFSPRYGWVGYKAGFVQGSFKDETQALDWLNDQ